MTRLKLSDNLKAYVDVATTNYIVVSVVPANGTLTLAHGTLVPARTTTITVTSSTISAGLVTITGTNLVTGLTDTEVLDLSMALTFTGTKVFSVISSVVISGLMGADPADRIVVGTGATAQLTVGRTTFVSATVGSGAGTIGKYQFIDNTTGTTTNIGELKAAIAAGTYKYKCSIALGLRVVMSGTTPITIIYAQ